MLNELLLYNYQTGIVLQYLSIYDYKSLQQPLIVEL